MFVSYVLYSSFKFLNDIYVFELSTNSIETFDIESYLCLMSVPVRIQNFLTDQTSISQKKLLRTLLGT